VAFVAAVLVILVVSAEILMLVFQLRSGWIEDHQIPMDKGTAIEKLLFR
jgi:hypothetical protein